MQNAVHAFTGELVAWLAGWQAVVWPRLLRYQFWNVAANNMLVNSLHYAFYIFFPSMCSPYDRTTQSRWYVCIMSRPSRVV